MTAIIFDNSTLSSVQRLCGNIEAPKSYDPHGDYSALENFFQSILFNDDYYFVDDYKIEHKEERKAAFPYIRPISPDIFPYDDLEKEAALLTKEFVLDIRGGRMADGVLKEFFENMGLHLTCAWHMSSSDFFLTLKILSKEDNDWETRYKYSPLTAMIFNQTNGVKQDVKVQSSPILFNSNGEPIVEIKSENKTSYSIGGELLNFSNSLNWLTLRAAFYALTSTSFSAALCTHPIRHNFLARWLFDKAQIDYSPSWRQNLSNFFGTKASEAVNAVNESTETTELGYDLPLFAAWAVGKTGSVVDAIKFIMDIRGGNDFSRLRSRFSEIEQMNMRHSSGKMKKEINNVRIEIEREAKRICDSYKVGDSSPLTVSVGAEIAILPKISFSIEREFPKFDLPFGKNRHVKSVFRNIVTDIVNFDKLGPVRRSMMKNVVRSKSFTVPALQIETERFFGRDTDWKKSM